MKIVGTTGFYYRTILNDEDLKKKQHNFISKMDM